MFATKQGRVQTLADNLLTQYKLSLPRSAATNSIDSKEIIIGLLSKLSTKMIFLGIEGLTINIWFLNVGREVVFRKGKLQGDSTYKDPIRALLHSAMEEIGADGRVTCENRTLDEVTCDYPSSRGACEGLESHYRLQTVLLSLFMMQLLVQFVTCFNLRTTSWSLFPTVRCALSRRPQLLNPSRFALSPLLHLITWS